MITFKPIIVPGNKRRDGVYPVKIRVTFKGVSRRLPTTLVCYPDDLTRANKIKNATILSKAEQIIKPMRDAVADITPFELDVRDVDWVIEFIKAKLAPLQFRQDFIAFGRHYLEGRTNAKYYLASLELFAEFVGGEIDINDITTKLLLEFVKWVELQPKRAKVHGVRMITEHRRKKNACYRELAKVASVFKAAKQHFNDEDRGIIKVPRSPFENIEMKVGIIEGQRNLGIELMQKIIADPTTDKVLRFALDVFVVSFALMGANIADMYSQHVVSGGVWMYQRSKTKDRRQDKAQMRVRIPEQLFPFLARLQGRDGTFLGRLAEKGKNKDRITVRVNGGLAKWCALNDVEPFTMYAARHSFASIARKIGIEKATVDECLAHVGDFRIADIYAERDWDNINAANAKVLACFEWPKE